MNVVAPRPRIQRDTRPQRQFQRRSDEHLLALHRGFAGQADADIARRLGDLSGALWRSPGHRDRLRALSLSPRDLRTLADLAHFPILTRADLAVRWDALPVLERSDVTLARSSGTTGVPVSVVRDAYDNLHMWTVLRFWTSQFQLELPRRPRVVLLDALPGGLEYSVRVPLFGDGALHRISTARPDALDRLLCVKPAVIFSDPAGLHWLAAHAPRIQPRVLLSSAQRLAPTLRAAFEAPVIDYYATTETGPIAWACLASPQRFHVLAPDVHVESVAGALLITRLRASALPLLRYAPGDRSAVDIMRCACGFVGQTIWGFTGRAAAAFVKPDGTEVDAWSVAWVFKHHPLRAFRLTQTSREGFKLQLDVAVIDRALLDRLSGALKNLGWSAPRIDVAQTDLSSAAVKHEPFLRTGM